MHRLPFIQKLASIGIFVAALSLPLMVGCAGAPSQEELGLLDEKRLTAEAAEQKVVELKAEKARLERKLATKKAEKQGLEKKLQTVRAAVANWPED